MNKVIEYEIVVQPQIESLERCVKLYLNEDWELYGFPFVDNEGDYCQAFIKRAEKNEENDKIP